MYNKCKAFIYKIFSSCQLCQIDETCKCSEDRDCPQNVGKSKPFEMADNRWRFTNCMDEFKTANELGGRALDT